MEYNSILQRIEDQKKEEGLSTKLYRYTGLIHAIEFFSQKLNLDQILEASFDFVNELLTLEKSAIFTLSGNQYTVKKVKGHVNIDMTTVKNSEQLQNLAVFHGTLLYERETLEKYFDRDMLDAFSTTMVIPLIMENMLFGFLLISNKTIGSIESDDYIISHSLMKLFNMALENYKRYQDLQKANRELDEKIFNLFAINQSSKALLSELNLDVLYNLSVDVFSELTQSLATGFVLYDEKAERFMLKAFRDVYEKGTGYIGAGLALNQTARIDINKVILDLTDEVDRVYLDNLFYDGSIAAQALNGKYIVLLIKNGKILGFVSLAPSVTGAEYKKSIFELIESLASATYIAVSNAQLFKLVNEQKCVIQGKFDKLVSLNHLMKNINSSSSPESLLDITLKTLEISFDVEKAMIALYDPEKECFNISHTLNIKTNKRVVKPNPRWKKIFEGDAIFNATQEGMDTFLNQALLKDIGTTQGISIFPIYIERMDIEVLGVILIFKYKSGFLSDEENRLTVETIAGHIAPVLGNLFTIEEQRRFSLPNYIELFKKDLKSDIKEAEALCFDLQVIQVIGGNESFFKNNSIVNKLKGVFPKVYPFSYHHIFMIAYDKIDHEDEIRKLSRTKGLKVRSLVLGKDFNSFKEFFTLF